MLVLICTFGSLNHIKLVWMHAGNVEAWQIEYALVVVFFGLEGSVLALSEDCRRLLHNRQAAMRALSSMRAWRRFKQASFLASAFRRGAAVNRQSPAVDVEPPALFDARLAPCIPCIPGVSPISSPMSQRRAFWACVVTQLVLFPAAAYGIMASAVLPGGALGIGLLLLISAPSIDWTIFSACGNAHNGV